ncbi:hypothetical protein NEF87_003069 [Candidatus Lokiarchaeum ossiferum]|uniref:Glycosyl transferase n=1 Tax=Candidatus Lokiarchaeum ossiferum TaxID=2951803 RepID=A0ABY6HWF0_9ARCH|nr:hypothetical protein NEF87_003069 [Candidatus Lokiarchaeum sp. B-35]
MKKYGYFDDLRKEYIITHPDTPLPWINYLGTDSYFSLISNTGGGYSFYKDARYRRLTRYRYNNTPFDSNGKYIYIRENKTGKFWSTTWQPTRHTMEMYQCQHGLGYTTIQSQAEKIHSNVTYFVPLNENLEIWKIKITNHHTHTVDLSLFSFVEFCLWDAQGDATNFQRNFNIGEVEIDSATSTIYHKTEYRERRNHFAFFSCSEPLKGYDTQREKFIGSYHSMESPVVVENGNSLKSHAHGWAPIGSHHIEVTLEPEQTKEIIFILGYSENKKSEKFSPPDSQILNKEKVNQKITYYKDPKNVEDAFIALKRYWDQLLSKFTIDTPDVHTNRMVNIWNQYQCMVTFNLSRSASFFESGIGRGMGFRDSNQDILGFVHLIPEKARQRILDLASTQMPSGGAYHQYQPLTKRGNHELGSNFNDDPLWLILSTVAYLKETGDFDILKEDIPFENQKNSEKSLLTHLELSLKYTLDRLGPHGLPLIGRADWNDCLNLNCFSEEPNQSFQTTANKEGKIAESLFIAGQFVYAAKQMNELFIYLKMVDKANHYSGAIQKMEEAIVQHGWDGEWFLRAYDDRGHKVGSHENNEGQIYIESQGMCLMAEVGKKMKLATKTLASVHRHLATPHGIMLHHPPYTRYHLELGEISSYPPGYKENGSIFCHTNPWIMIAEAMNGNPEQAYNYYLRINPSAREHLSDLHRCEPYIYAQTIAGYDAPTFGEAKNSWLTGTAAWNFVAISQYILGIHPTFNGLTIEPKVPQTWLEYKVSRLFRGVIYSIEVKRVEEGENPSCEVDGIQVNSSTIPLPDVSKKEVKVLIKIP